MSIKFVRLNHVALSAPKGEAERVRFFYKEQLGLKEVPPPKVVGGDREFDFLSFQFPNFTLNIYFALPPVAEGIKPKFFELKDLDKPHFAIEVENIKEVRKEMEKKKIYIFDDSVLEDRERFKIKDPFGNVMEIIELH